MSDTTQKCKIKKKFVSCKEKVWVERHNHFLLVILELEVFRSYTKNRRILLYNLTKMFEMTIFELCHYSCAPVAC